MRLAAAFLISNAVVYWLAFRHGVKWATDRAVELIDRS